MNKISYNIIAIIEVMLLFLTILINTRFNRFIFASIILMIIFFIYNFLFKNRIDTITKNSIDTIFKIACGLIGIPLIIYGLYLSYAGLYNKCESFAIIGCLLAPPILIVGIILLSIVIKIFKKTKTINIYNGRILIIIGLIIIGIAAYRFNSLSTMNLDWFIFNLSA